MLCTFEPKTPTCHNTTQQNKISQHETTRDNNTRQQHETTTRKKAKHSTRRETKLLSSTSHSHDPNDVCSEAYLPCTTGSQARFHRANQHWKPNCTHPCCEIIAIRPVFLSKAHRRHVTVKDCQLDLRYSPDERAQAVPLLRAYSGVTQYVASDANSPMLLEYSQRFYCFP